MNNIGTIPASGVPAALATQIASAFAFAAISAVISRVALRHIVIVTLG